MHVGWVADAHARHLAAPGYWNKLLRGSRTSLSDGLQTHRGSAGGMAAGAKVLPWKQRSPALSTHATPKLPHTMALHVCMIEDVQIFVAGRSTAFLCMAFARGT